MDENEIRQKIIEFFAPAKIERRKAKRLDEIIEEENLIHVDRRDLSLFNILENWNQGYKDYYLILPQNFFPKISAREKRKRIKELKLSREKTRTKEYAIRNRITPFKLIKEKTEEIRQKYRENKKVYSFLGFSWRYQNKNKLIYTRELIEGYILYRLGKQLIKSFTYFTEGNLCRLIDKDEFEKLIKRYEIYKGKKIEEVGGIISGEVPSRTENKNYNVWIYHIPLVSRKNYGFGVWLETTKLCGCEAQGWHKTTYLRPKNEEIFCAHSIALYLHAWYKGINYGSKIFMIPFPKPTKKLFSLYKSIRKNVFIEREEQGRIKKKQLDKPEIELLLNRAIILNYTDLF